MSNSYDDLYRPDYCHFDDIIWQLPAWASAVFAFTVVGCGHIMANSEKIHCIWGISTIALLSTLLYLVSVIYIFLFYVLYRFRMHQAGIQAPKTVGGKLGGFIGGQIILQMIIAIEGASLCFAATWLLSKCWCWCVLIFVVVIIMMGITEGYISREKKKLKISAGKKPVVAQETPPVKVN